MSEIIKDATQLRNSILKGIYYPELNGVTAVILDPATLENLNPDILTTENVWEVCAIFSMCTVNSGEYVLYKADVLDNPINENWTPEQIKEFISTLLIQYSEGKRRRSVIADLESKNGVKPNIKVTGGLALSKHSGKDSW